jgi:hypothetical protein
MSRRRWGIGLMLREVQEHSYRQIAEVTWVFFGLVMPRAARAAARARGRVISSDDEGHKVTIRVPLRKQRACGRPRSVRPNTPRIRR